MSKRDRINDVKSRKRRTDTRYNSYYIAPIINKQCDEMRIYLTHCSAKKDDSLKHSGRKVTPDKLYTATQTQRFMDKCKERQVRWAILSDLYGIWFPHEKHEWYEKDPDAVTEEEFKNLVRDFEEKLREYDEIYFYHNPGRFHPLYIRLLNEVEIKGKIVLFSHIAEI